MRHGNTSFGSARDVRYPFFCVIHKGKNNQRDVNIPGKKYEVFNSTEGLDIAAKHNDIFAKY
jgi:hypothetical protein